MRSPIFTTVLFGLLFVCPFAVAQDDFVSLFNGEDLTGWTVKGGDAKFHVEDGCIVGAADNTGRNTFLCCEKEYANFIFKVEFKFDKEFNSGIQFRSAARPYGDQEEVYGYQCEMLATEMTAAIWDENRRNRWLNDVTDEFREKTKKFYKSGEWNELEIQCIGPSIRTWLNGQPITDVFDTMTDSGFFGLQVHAADSGQIRWRDIRIKELPPTPWKSFFDGKNKKFVDLEVKPVGTWEFLGDGTVSGSLTADEIRDGMVLSTESFDNFAVRVSFIYGGGNSGMYFRAHDVEAEYWLCGYQCEIEAYSTTGGLWEVGGGASKGRGFVYQPPSENANNFKIADWNDVSTVATGDRIVTILNGAHVADIIDPDCLKSGKTGLQLHCSQYMRYLFRNYDIMPLNKELVELITR